MIAPWGPTIVEDAALLARRPLRLGWRINSHPKHMQDVGLLVLAAVLRNAGEPLKSRAVEEAVVLVLVPRLLRDVLPPKAAAQWDAAVGRDSIELRNLHWLRVVRLALQTGVLAWTEEGDLWEAGEEIAGPFEPSLNARAIVALSYLASKEVEP